MRNLLIFVIAVSISFVVAFYLNAQLEKISPGASLDSFKRARIQAMQRHLPQSSKNYDVLFFGDSLLEILFEPIEFDQLEQRAGRATTSWNLALRSMDASDFTKIINSFSTKEEKFESCLVQVPALHFSSLGREGQLLKFWPGLGLSDYLNLWNPLSRLDHNFDSPANLWTGKISQHMLPWDESRRGGVNQAQSPFLPALRQVLKTPAMRQKLNAAYNQIMGLSDYKFDKKLVLEFARAVNQMSSHCQKVQLVWPVFSPELRDRTIGPDPQELKNLRDFISENAKMPILEMPFQEDKDIFLDSQHIDPEYRKELHTWLVEVI